MFELICEVCWGFNVLDIDRIYFEIEDLIVFVKDGCVLCILFWKVLEYVMLNLS